MMKKHKEMIFGIHAITQAILTGQSIAKIWIKRTIKTKTLQELLALIKQEDIPCSRVPVEKLHRLTNGNHQGAIALISPVSFLPLDTLLQITYEKGKHPFLIVLDHLQDMRNLGAIARTALATDVDAIIINTHKSLPITGDAIKTSAGALLHVPLCRTRNLYQTLRALQHSGLQLIACTEKGPKDLYQITMQQPTALLMGGEHQGIHPKNIALCHEHIRIPMSNNIDSLNVSVATAIVLYEYVRQHRVKQ